VNVDGKPYRTIWLADDGRGVEIIDQTKLPFTFEVIRLEDCAAAAAAIRDMWVRGAPLIGATAAYGMALAMREDPSDGNVTASAQALMTTRPTAVNLRWDLFVHRRSWAVADPQCLGSARQARPRKCVDPLQRRLAGDGRLGHRACTDLQGP
jgi:methylthioribose-1-phosphate isomerase